MKSIMAFTLGMIAMGVLTLGPAQTTPQATAAGPGSLYYDMGVIHVQYESEACGFKTLAVTYQIVYEDEAKTSYITAFKPKIQSVLFADLNDHLAQTKNTNPKRLQRVMFNSIQDALGPDTATDVLIMNSTVNS